jgi:DUF4097 and DUF4098 domain-containing protein YvlB
MTTFTTAEPITAVLDLPAGTIQLVAAEQTETTVEVKPADPSKKRDVSAAEEAQVSYAGGVLTVQVKAKNQYFGPSGSVAVSVQLPTGSAVEVKAASAQLKAVGRYGDFTVESSHGAIDLEDVASAKLTTSAGDIAVGRLHGPAEIRTSAGDIRIAEASRGDVVLRTDAGAIEIVAAAGTSATLDAGTASGRISNSLKNSGDADLNIKATTSVGDITAASL